MIGLQPQIMTSVDSGQLPTSLEEVEAVGTTASVLWSGAAV
jgi:hypothetical protein